MRKIENADGLPEDSGRTDGERTRGALGRTPGPREIRAIALPRPRGGRVTSGRRRAVDVARGRASTAVRSVEDRGLAADGRDELRAADASIRFAPETSGRTRGRERGAPVLGGDRRAPRDP